MDPRAQTRRLTIGDQLAGPSERPAHDLTGGLWWGTTSGPATTPIEHWIDRSAVMPWVHDHRMTDERA